MEHADQAPEESNDPGATAQGAEKSELVPVLGILKIKEQGTPESDHEEQEESLEPRHSEAAGSETASNRPSTRPFTPLSSVLESQCSSRPGTSCSRISASSASSRSRTADTPRELKRWLEAHALGHLSEGLQEYGVRDMNQLAQVRSWNTPARQEEGAVCLISRIWQVSSGMLEHLGSRSDWQSTDVLGLAE